VVLHLNSISNVIYNVANAIRIPLFMPFAFWLIPPLA
jgi:hypothetical protein